MANDLNNTPAPPLPPAGDGSTGKSHWIERAVALVVAVWIVGLISYLILSERDYRPEDVFFLKILLSFSMAVLVATSAGYANLEFNLAGIAIRAGGAIAVFIFVYTQSPSVPALGLSEPRINMNEIRGIDFRAVESPESAEFSTSPVAVTVPIELKNEADYSRTGTWRKSTVSMHLDGKDVLFKSYYFVRLLPGVAGTWLSSGEVSPAKQTDLREGDTVAHEVMHLSDSGPTWSSFLKHIDEAKAPFVVSIAADVDGGPKIKTCKFDPTRYAAAVKKIADERNRLPGYVSVLCEG